MPTEDQLKQFLSDLLQCMEDGDINAECENEDWRELYNRARLMHDVLAA